VFFIFFCFEGEIDTKTVGTVACEPRILLDFIHSPHILEHQIQK